MCSSPARASPISARPRGATRCTRTSPIPPSSPTRCGCSSSASRAASRRKGETGAQPEWFYKGDGSILVAPGGRSGQPGFALDGGEEPEIVGIYLIDDAGAPVRIGFALGNEFSDHVTERQNYLWLAHSKLRPASVGPELLVGDLPADVQGVSRIRRGKEVIWEKPFLSGEQNMAHSIANLEAHHFKYALFRRPGDVHVHFFGTATLSFSDGVQTREGRRVRDRVRSPSACRCATGSRRKGRRRRGCGRFRDAPTSLPTGRAPKCARSASDWPTSPMTVARARCHQPLRRGRGGSSAAGAGAASRRLGLRGRGLQQARRPPTSGAGASGSTGARLADRGRRRRGRRPRRSGAVSPGWRGLRNSRLRTRRIRSSSASEGGESKPGAPVSRAPSPLVPARTGFARRANVSSDGGARLRRADLSCRTRRRRRSALTRSPPISATTARPSSVGCGASCGRIFAERALAAAPAPAPAAAPADLAFVRDGPSPALASARDLFASSSPGRFERCPLHPPRPAPAPRRSAAKSSASACGGSASLLTPVAGSPRSIAW